MNNLKTVRRSMMGQLLLRVLMIICELGADWKDTSKIPVKEIIEIWREAPCRSLLAHHRCEPSTPEGQRDFLRLTTGLWYARARGMHIALH